MPLQLDLVPDLPDASYDGSLVIVGRKTRLKSEAVRALLPDAASPLWDAMVGSLRAGDFGAATSSWVPTDGGSPRRIVAAAVPTASSRHNSPMRADAIAGLIKAHTPGKGDAWVVIALDDADHAIGAACAAARAYPLFGRKAGGRAAKGGKAGEAGESGKSGKSGKRKTGGDGAKGDARAAAKKGTGSAARRGDDPGHDGDGGAGKGEATDPASGERVVRVTLLGPAGPITELGRHRALAAGIRDAARMVDAPTSELDTDAFVAEARAVSEALGAAGNEVEVEVIRGEALRDGGFGGLWGVGRAATGRPPSLVRLTWSPPGAKRTVAWVGKGIVYDTGGLSIKGRAGMVGMKRDMGGAAAVLQAFRVAVSQGFPDRLHAVLCLAENAIGPDATRPDDILTMYSGKTVEVNNTDAEGRLVLADGVAWAARDLKADVIVDVATLTGAQMMSTGQRHAAIMANEEGIEARAVAVGRATGDLVHPLPYAPEFFRSEFKSQVADLKNSVKNRMNAQASCAGQFVGEHLGRDYEGAWLHVDIAGPSHKDGRGTGYGVALLTELFRDGDPTAGT